MYDEVRYWNARKNPNSSDPSRADHDYLMKQLKGTVSVLDFGPGVGRTFDVYNGQVVCGYDITAQYEKRATERADLLGVEYIPISVEENEHLPFSHKVFDAAVCCEVLHHQRPEYIESIMRDLLRVSEKVIVVAAHDPDVAFDKRINQNHCYNHDYRGICERNVWLMTETKQTENQLFFCYD